MFKVAVHLLVNFAVILFVYIIRLFVVFFPKGKNKGGEGGREGSEEDGGSDINSIIGLIGPVSGSLSGVSRKISTVCQNCWYALKEKLITH